MKLQHPPKFLFFFLLMPVIGVAWAQVALDGSTATPAASPADCADADNDGVTADSET